MTYYDLVENYLTFSDLFVMLLCEGGYLCPEH